MEVILSQDIAPLGHEGDLVKVKDGYARNYLIPKKLAYHATTANRKKIELQKKRRQEKYENEKAQAQQLADQLNKVSCTVSVEVNDLDKLYGAVSEADILKAIELEGHTIDRRNLVIEKPIEELGIFEVGVKLHPEIMAKIRLWVTKK